MKNTILLLFAIVLLGTACQNDDDNEPNVNDLIQADLNHDGPNFSAPALDDGTHLFAARFTADDLAAHNGKQLDEALFYLLDVPAECAIFVMGEGTSSSPGDILYSADISNSVGPNGWNQHNISPAIDITSDDIWIVVQVVHNGSTQSLGCDEGSAVANGDWISSSTAANLDWQTFRSYTNNLTDINWNIRARVSD